MSISTKQPEVGNRAKREKVIYHQNLYRSYYPDLKIRQTNPSAQGGTLEKKRKYPKRTHFGHARETG